MTLDGTGRLIECREKKGKEEVEERKSASGTDGREEEENEGKAVEDFRHGHIP